jgi:hypothetical protein
VCGDGYCEGGESCDTCDWDCGSCGPVCGDGYCDWNEYCDTCPLDCGGCGGGGGGGDDECWDWDCWCGYYSDYDIFVPECFLAY